ncbi:hypothetical protein Lser_V15G26153 [Lactuca serriola]
MLEGFTWRGHLSHRRISFSSRDTSVFSFFHSRGVQESSAFPSSSLRVVL